MCEGVQEWVRARVCASSKDPKGSLPAHQLPSPTRDPGHLMGHTRKQEPRMTGVPQTPLSRRRIWLLRLYSHLL